MSSGRAGVLGPFGVTSALFAFDGQLRSYVEWQEGECPAVPEAGSACDPLPFTAQ